jgi:hypothetical protein
VGYNPAVGSTLIGAGTQVYTWSFPICPHAIRVDLSVIGAFQHYISGSPGPKQGLLLGRRRSGVTRIEACEPLSDFETKTAAAAIASAKRSVVGYYRVRDGRAFVVDASEVELMKSLFPEPGSVFLLMERRAEGPAEGTFSFWRGDAFVSNLPYPFPIDRRLLADEPDPMALIAEYSQTPRGRLGRAVGVLAAAAVVGALILLPWIGKRAPAGRSAKVAAPPEEMSIPAQVQGEVEIRWDPQAVSRATAGLLKISDGRFRHPVSLDRTQLLEGSFFYSGASGPIAIELKALLGDGQMIDIPVDAHPLLPPSLSRMAEAQPPAAPFAVPPRQLAQPPSAAAPPTQVPIVTSRPAAVKRFELTSLSGAASSNHPSLLDPPPVHEALSAPAGASAAPPLTTAPALTTAIPAPAPPVEHTNSAERAASLLERGTAPPDHPAVRGSGRLIWTGTLPRRGVVEFDNRSATVGSLNGALPGVPVNVTILPAEFGSDGLVVYTTDAKRDKKIERPSPGNGWNKITYIWDPERVSQIAVLETPNASNRFSHLALRSDARHCSMLLIDWVAVSPTTAP